MKTYLNPQKSQWSDLVKRPVFEQKSLLNLVTEIFEDIRINRDKAVEKYGIQFDNIVPNELKVRSKSILEAENQLSVELRNAIALAKENIETFHKSQFDWVEVVETSAGVFCWRESRAIERVGIYIPGGTAPLFSTVLMLGIPAILAQCRQIVLCTPPDKNGNIHPAILFTANMLGINEIFAVGGIQAIAAMTFGTETIPAVDKVFGPGNQYVTAAKQYAQNFGIAVDMPAGPSEVLVIADESANPVFVAADLLSQAEHGDDSQVVLLSDSEVFLSSCLKELEKQLNNLPRKDVAAKAISNSRAILLDNIQSCIEFSNTYAPEHLILAVKDYKKFINSIQSAGSVFLGNYSCESAGDYASGTNHTLPTNGYARSFSGVSLDSFTKKITFQEINANGILNIGPAIEVMADAEKLFAHKNAVSVRIKNLKYD